MSEASFQFNPKSVVDDIEIERRSRSSIEDPVALALEDAERAMKALIERIEREANGRVTDKSQRRAS